MLILNDNKLETCKSCGKDYLGKSCEGCGVYCPVHDKWFTSDEVDPCDIPF